VGKKDRILNLSGKATFNAGHKGKGRLQIQADRLVIEDIGTIFTISAYPDSNNIVVSVKEGLVNLHSGKNKSLQLKANETCRYDKRYKTFHPSISDENQQKDPTVQTTETSLKDYYFQFDSKPLHSVVETISKDYGVNIEIESPAIGLREITVHFDQEKLEVILNIVAETMNLKVKKIADGYMLCSK